MSRLLAVVALLLAPFAWCHDIEEICASVRPQEGEEGRYACHPDNPNYAVKCYKIKGRLYGVVAACDEGYFSVALGACVDEQLSDCAASDKPETHYQELCVFDSHSVPRDTPSSIRFICHPHDPRKFVACPPNLAWTRVLSCVGDRHFSAVEGKCVPPGESDCAAPPGLAGPIDIGPDASAMVMGNSTAGNDTQASPQAANIGSWFKSLLNSNSAAGNATASANATTSDEDVPVAAAMVMSPNSTLVSGNDTASANTTAPGEDVPVAAAMVMSPNSTLVSGNDTAPGHEANVTDGSGPDAAAMRFFPGPTHGSSHGVAGHGAAPASDPWRIIPTQQPPYCPDSAPFPINCVPKPNSAPRNFYPQNPTYPVNPRDPRRFGPGPHPLGTPPAACRARYLYHPEVADWEGARAICELEGGQLAVITSEREQGRIASRFGKLKEFWIGATDIEREGQFRWVNGQGLGFARWYRSQPNKKYPNNEHCVTFNYWGKDAKWGDRNCFDSRPFLCETMICEPMRNRFPTGFPGGFNGPLRSPINFPRNRNFPGPRGIGGVSARHWPRGRGFPYNSWQDLRTPING